MDALDIQITAGGAAGRLLPHVRIPRAVLMDWQHGEPIPGRLPTQAEFKACLEGGAVGTRARRGDGGATRRKSPYTLAVDELVPVKSCANWRRNGRKVTA